MLAIGSALGAAVHRSRGESQPPTFNRDIAPIIYANCVQCHRPSQVAPFSLLTYEEVKKRDKQIAEVTRSRFMPPWLPEPPTEERAAFHGDRRLTLQQIALIQDWVNGGAIEGDKTVAPPAPQFDERWKLGEPDQIVVGEEYTVPAEDRDTIRTFVIPVSLPLRKLIKAIDFRSGNPRAVHHASFLIDKTKTARLLDADDPQPGYRGMGDIGLNLAGSFGTWSPGGGAAVFPEGMGRNMPKEIDLVIEIHFNPTGKPETVKPQVALYFVHEQIEHQVLNVSLGSFFIDIAPGEEDYRVSDSMQLPATVKLLGVSPHAHYICRRIKAEARLPDGSCLNLLVINDWDFNWQQEFRYRAPIELPAGTALHVEFAYDNSQGNPRNPNDPPKRVRSGATAADEMALLFFTMVAADEKERPKLEEAHQLQLIERMKDAQNRRALNPTGPGT
jgi:hypothetical protein